MIPRIAKRLGLAAGAALVVPTLARRLLGERGLIFMLHRFRNPDSGVPGHEPEELRRMLDYLRGRGCELVRLDELIRRLVTNQPKPRGAIAFTIDDGYLDQATVGGPVFAEFDCPVTTFVTTGFLDRTIWFWWDQIAYVFSRTGAHRVRVRLGDQTLDYQWSSVAERDGVCQDLAVRCKSVAEEVKAAALTHLATEAGVALPPQAPIEYAPMSWDDVRRCESRGMSFGSHTVTHPVLSRTSDEQSEFEIAESWRRLEAEATTPMPVFCYPNGQPGDYGDREFRTLARLGMHAAVVGTPGYVHRDAFTKGDAGRFQVPRNHWPEEITEVARYASGLERFLQLIIRRG